MSILDKLKDAFSPGRTEPPLGVDARTLAIILFGLGVILSGIAYQRQHPWWWAPLIFLGLILWVGIGRLAAFFFEGCYGLATQRHFTDVRAHIEPGGRGRLHNQRLLRSVSLLLWPIFLLVFCPILLTIWFVTLLYSD